MGAANGGLRAATLASKFLLTMLLARVLGAERLGAYGLVVSSVSIGLTLLGLEYYQYTLREIASAAPEVQARRLRDQAVLHLVVGLLGFLLLALLRGRLPLSPGTIWWFLPILLVEHAAQELGRALITIGHSTATSFVLFLRGGAWVLVLIPLFLGGLVAQHLEVVWICWLVGSLSGACVGLWALRRLPWRAAWHRPVDRSWLVRGLRVSLRLAVATAALVALLASGRYALQRLGSPAAVGHFTFFTSIASLVQTFVEATVVSVRFPGYVAAHQAGGREAARRVGRDLWRAAVGVAVLLMIGAGVLGIWVLPRLVGAEYGRDRVAFVLLLLSYGMVVAGWAGQFRLFVAHADSAIMGSAIVALGVTWLAQWGLVPVLGTTGAAAGTLLGTTLLAVSRLALARRVEARRA